MFRKNHLLALTILLLIMLVSGACNRHLVHFNPDKAVYYPAPPDTARLQFLTSISTSKAIEKQRSGFARFLLGELPEKHIIKPYGITTFGSKIYICDTEIGGIEIIDLEKKKFEYFIPRGKGQLSKPFNCCLDEEGKLYVADGKRQQIVVFDPSGFYLNAFGEAENLNPTDVSISGSVIFVVDLDNHRIIAYRKDTYSKLYEFPGSLKGAEDYLYSPVNIFVNDSVVFVSDMGDSKVKKYTHQGTFISSFGSYGKNWGQFVRIKGIAADRESNLYAVDASFENVQVFNSKDQLLMFFGGPTEGPGRMWLPAKVAIDYENTEYFQQFTDPDYYLEYLIYVTNQFGPDKLNVYGFIKPKSPVIK